MSKYEWYMDLKYEPYIIISCPIIYKQITKMNTEMDIQQMKNRQDLKPVETSDTPQESNEESSGELGICIVP